MHINPATAAASAAVVLAAGAIALGPIANAAGHLDPTVPRSEPVRAAELLADDTPGTDYFSPHLVGELGYTPTLESGSATRADGDCSSPVPLPASFEPACRTHDLGYDLLRVTHRFGEPLPAGLRRDLDARLARDMHASCPAADGGADLSARIDAAGCHAMATIAYRAVQVNTLRQHNGAPVEEMLPW